MIQRGLTYRLRYRTLNGAGWSDYSPVLYALAATVPTPPPPPSLVSASSTAIHLSFEESSDNGGSKILFYELHMDNGILGSNFDKVMTYDESLTMWHIIT